MYDSTGSLVRYHMPADKPAGKEQCDRCGAEALEWIKCKQICSNCRQIARTCADL